MITFKDVKQEKELTYFLVPGYIHGEMVRAMKKDVPVIETYTSLQVLREKAPDISKISQARMAGARAFFKNHGFINIQAIGLIVSHSNIDDLRKKALLFSGNTMDPDLKTEQLKDAAKADEYNARLLKSYSDKESWR